MKSPDKLPFRVFDAGSKLPEEKQAEANDTLRRLRLFEHSELSAEKREIIFKLINNYDDWGKKYLSIDLGQRLPEITKIHILRSNSPEGEKMIKIFPGLKEDPWTIGTTITNSDEVIIWEDKVNEKIETVVNHELTHILGRKSVVIKKNAEEELVFKTQNSGYGNVNSKQKEGAQDEVEFPLSGLNEMITETINIEVLQHLKKQQGNREKTYLEGYFGYDSGVIFFDMIIEQIAKRTDQEQEAVRKKLYRGYFKGDMAELRVIKSVFGLDAIQWLAKLQPDNIGRELILPGEYIFGLDIHAYLKKTRDYEKGKPITLSNGIRIKRQTPK